MSGQPSEIMLLSEGLLTLGLSDSGWPVATRAMDIHVPAAADVCNNVHGVGFIGTMHVEIRGPC